MSCIIATVDTIAYKARKGIFFTIYKLTSAGIRQCDLLRMSVFRPVLDNACLVWHTSLSIDTIGWSIQADGLLYATCLFEF